MPSNGQIAPEDSPQSRTRGRSAPIIHRAARRLALGDFELWAPRLAALLTLAALALVAYWVAWLSDRNAVASTHTGPYLAFEQAFPLADAWLAAAALIAAVQLSRRRATAILWLCVVGGASLYLFALDVLYDLQHGIYADARAGTTELIINLATAALGIGVLRFAWRFRTKLVGLREAGADRERAP